MKTLQHNFNTWALLLTMLLALTGCSNDDDTNDDDVPIPLAAWEIEVNTLKDATSQYIDFQVALDEGRIDVSGYVPNMGHHFLSPALADGVFEINKPEILLYLPDENKVMQLAAVEYSIIPEDPKNPGNAPAGFSGDLDVWNFNEAIGQWQLHVWIILANPNGIFAGSNPAIGD